MAMMLTVDGARRGRKASGLLMLAAAAILTQVPSALFPEASVQAAPGVVAFHCGDRVTAKVPIKLSNDGRGYYNEGGGEGTARHLRDMADEIAKRDAKDKIVDFGAEGTVVGIIPTGEWGNRPRHWKGTPRAGIMVNWDDAEMPMDVAETFELEITDSSQGDKLIAQRKAKKGAK